VPDPADLFAHVYSRPTPQLVEQLAQVRDELSRDEPSPDAPNRAEAR
jgi:hypothetical protein